MIKRYLTFVALFLTLGIQANAQNYKTLFPKGRVWKCVETGAKIFFGEDKPFTVIVGADTIVDNKVCKILISSFDNKEEPDRKSVVYEEDGKVYMYGSVYGEVFFLIMDFNMKKGDKYYQYEDEYRTITDTGTIVVNGVERRYWVVDNKGLWVEGIGYNNDFAWLAPVVSHCGIYDYMEACYDNGELMFSKSDFDNIVTGINSLKADRDTDHSGRIYNLSGEQVNGMEGGGIYIKNGRKYATQRHH